MAGGKGKSIGGGKGSGAKDSASKSQKSHSAKAGLQVCCPSVVHHPLFLVNATLNSPLLDSMAADLMHRTFLTRFAQNIRLRWGLTHGE
jgi:histone H2A